VHKLKDHCQLSPASYHSTNMTALQATLCSSSSEAQRIGFRYETSQNYMYLKNTRPPSWFWCNICL